MEDLRVPDQNLRLPPQKEHSVIVVKPAAVKDRLSGIDQAEDAAGTLVDVRLGDGEAVGLLRPDAVGAAAKQAALLHAHILAGVDPEDVGVALALLAFMADDQALQDGPIAVDQGHHIRIPVLGDQAHRPALLRLQGKAGGVIDRDFPLYQAVRVYISAALRNLLLCQIGEVVVAGFQNDMGVRGDDPDQLGGGGYSDRIVRPMGFHYLFWRRGIGFGVLLRICLSAGRQRGQQQKRQAQRDPSSHGILLYFRSLNQSWTSGPSYRLSALQ